MKRISLYRDDIRLGPQQKDAAGALAEVVAVFLGVPAHGLGRVERPIGKEFERMQRLFRGGLTFIVGHEYAHILAAHGESPKDKSFHWEIYSGRSEAEVEADWLGAKLVLAPWRWGTFHDDSERRGNRRLLPPLSSTLLLNT